MIVAYIKFNKESGHYVEECKLRAVYVAPSRSPSPFQEGAEVDFSPCASVSDSGHGNASEYAEARADVISRQTVEKSSALQNNKLQQELTTEAVLKTEVSKLRPFFKEPCGHEISERLNAGHFEGQEEEATPVKKKKKYISNLLTKSAKSAKSSKNDHLEVIKETTKGSEKFDANSPEKTDMDVEQNLTLSEPNPTIGSPEQTPLISTCGPDSTVSFKEPRDSPEDTNDVVDDKFGQALDLMLESANNQGHMDVDDDYDVFDNLESVLSGSSFSLGHSTNDAPLPVTQQEEISKAVKRLGDLLAMKLEDIFDKPEERASLENIITLLAVNEKEISIGLRHFIPCLKESAAFIFNQFSKYIADVKAFSALEAEKQELHQLGQEGKKEKQEIEAEICKTKAVIDSCSAEMSTLEQEISSLHRQLEESKSCYRDSSQQCSMLQTERKVILEKAKGLLERGKKIMETRPSVQIKHDEALLQQATLKQQWTSLRGTFLKYLSKYQN